MSKDRLLSLGKYTLLTFGGFLTDMILSPLLYYTLQWPLVVCGGLGLLAGATVSYFIDLKSTFKSRNLLASWMGLFTYLKATTLAIFIRLAVLSLLSWFSQLPAFISFLLAVGIANSVRFAISHFYIFRKNPE